MKKSKLRKLRIKALFLLFLMLFQIISPTVSFALASGPTQPDFAGYEDANTSDMVNLITGDFTYNVPIFEIPSPEGGFKMPLSYHAGIQLEEESSWVGLGWSLNAGAIARNVSQYPDDYEGRPETTTKSGITGDGYIHNFIAFQTYYDSEKGKGGTFGYGNVFTIGVGSMSESSTLLGISSKNGQTQFDAIGFASGVTEIAILVASYGSSGISQSSIGALQAVDMVLTAAQAFNENSPTNSGSSASSASDWKKSIHMGFFNTTYSYYLDFNKTEQMFGSLYLNKIDNDGGLYEGNRCYSPFIQNNSISSINSSNYSQFVPRRFQWNQASTYLPVSDMHMANDGSGEYAYLIAPTSIAYDNYNVMGGGISGAIKPFRLDVGSLAYSNFGDVQNAKYDIVNFLDYKVPFKYDNDAANSYTNPLGINNNNITNPSYGFLNSNEDYTSEDISSNLECDWQEKIDNDWWVTPTVYIQDGVFPNWLITDPTVNSEFAANYIPNNRKEGNRADLSLKDNQLASGKFVKWYSNAEILSGTAESDGFMDFLNHTQRASLPTEGIGGFMITREDGLTYHYSLPVYNKGTYSYFHKANGLTATLSDGNLYAYDWLLTGITGPDFVDRNTIGIMDSQDYGYWVKMDYGLFSSDYKWRNPYFGNNYSPSSMGETSITQGSKETYYLNKISTRTHTALFIKSLKSDGKGAYSTTSGMQPSSSLKLDDIILLSNQDYQTLITQKGLSPDFNSGGGNTTIKNSDTFNNVLDNYDVSSSTIQSFLIANQIRKIHFNYSYSLCGKTYNSFDFLSDGSSPSYDPNNFSAMDLNLRKGKLTLESFDVYGKGNFKILPPFIFNYGNLSDLTQNPNYEPNKWDGWGMYKSTAANNTTSHNANNEGAQWSLRKIITPLGAEISVSYDRDSYSSINGNPITLANSTLAVDATNNTIIISNNLVNSFNIGDVLTINAHVESFSLDTWNSVWYQTDDRIEVIQVTVSALNGTILTVSPNILSAINVVNYNPSGTYPSSQSDFSDVTFSVSGNFQQSNLICNGGDLRVKEISIMDENSQIMKTKYVYTKDGIENSVTSGVVSFEPEFSRTQNYSFYKYFDQPVTPVLYSKVTVYSNISNSNSSYLSKTEFNFTTPDQSYLTFNTIPMEDRLLRREKVQDFPFDSDKYLNLYSKMYHMVFKDYTSRIGSLNSIKIWNNKSQLLKKVNFTYSDNSNFDGDLPNKQGIYGESTILADRYNFPSNTDWNIYYRLNRTSKVKFPYVLKNVEVITDDKTVLIENHAFDFITGQPNTVITKFSNSKTYTTTVIPAYYKYPGMGSKVADIDNKNMLSQKTAEYNYVSFNSEANKLSSASVNTWRNSWSYRKYNSGGWYKDYSESGVWRKEQAYVWKSLLNTDGTIPSFVDYVWGASSQNYHWQKVNEVSRYNHFSQPLESKDINERFVSKKMGYNESYAIATVTNAKYTSFAYSGAEDIADGNYFGGEVAGASKRFKSNSFSHTGNWSVRLSPTTQSDFGFTYNGSIGTSTSTTSDFKQGQKIRASVWLHKNNKEGGRLAYNLVKDDGTSSDGYGDVDYLTAKLFGDWYLLTLDFKIPETTTATTLSVIAWYPTGAGSGYVYFDDFRVHPQDAIMTSTVYDEKTGWVKAVLDADNFGTKYDYDDAGRLISTQKESMQGFKTVSENTYHYH